MKLAQGAHQLTQLYSCFLHVLNLMFVELEVASLRACGYRETHIQAYYLDFVESLEGGPSMRVWDGTRAQDQPPGQALWHAAGKTKPK